MKHHRTRPRAEQQHPAPRSVGKPSVGAVVGILTLASVVLFMMWLLPREQAPGPTASAEHSGASAPLPWVVGRLRPDGLRIVVSGRDDAAAVLDPKQFSNPDVRHGYWIATQIPALLNKLYCWCGCENRGQHRSNLQCFEDQMAADCRVCLGTAEIAYKMSQEGINDAAKVQAAVDRVWQPK